MLETFVEVAGTAELSHCGERCADASDYSLMRSVPYFQDSAKCHSGQSSGHVMLNKTALLATQIRHLNRVRIIIKIPYNTAKHGEPTRF